MAAPVAPPTNTQEVRQRYLGKYFDLDIFQISEEALAKRTAYLKLQRDKLLAMKKAEREKQLADAESSQLKSRPKSARAARSALGAHGRKQIDPKTLEIRKALAEKLKQEVIDDQD